jgi:hypothetical protein
MLSCVLSSEKAIAVNIQVIRVFAKMREMLLTHKDILLKLEQIERKLAVHDEDIQLIRLPKERRRSLTSSQGDPFDPEKQGEAIETSSKA